MKSMFFAAALTMTLTLSVPGKAATNTQPALDKKPMPVLFEQNGNSYQVVAEKDGAYYPVFIVAGGAPYFEDSNKVSHYVSSDRENFGVFYVTFQDKKASFVAVPNGRSDEEVKTVLVSGNSDVKDQLVWWGRRRGWYRYCYRPIYNYCYYPRYYYGGYYGGGYYGGGYNNGGYYGGGYNNGGYYGGGYYGNNGYYGGGYSYTGYGYYMNNGWW